MSTASDPIDPELVHRFRAALFRLNPESAKIGLAVSGGPDSMAMLLLAHASIPGAFEVATVDHGLRSEAKDECASVVSACEARGIPCEVLSVQVSKGNVQAKAREARYAALQDWAFRQGLTAIATAHHADDQAETLLMRLNRGSGVEGLAGVRERGGWPGSGVPILRPLLGFCRAELGAVVATQGIEAAHDPSNLDTKFDRVRMRMALADADWLDAKAMAESAGNLADAAEALAWAASNEFADHVTTEAGLTRYSPNGPRAIRLAVLSRVLIGLGADARGGQVSDLLDRLESGEKGNVGGVLVSADAGQWLFRPEPPRRTS